MYTSTYYYLNQMKINVNFAVVIDDYINLYTAPLNRQSDNHKIKVSVKLLDR